MLKSVMSLAFFGCFRAGELCQPDTVNFDPKLHLTFGDITFDLGNSQISLFLKQSKTDRTNTGVEVRIGCSSHAICAYCLLSQYVQRHPDPRDSSPLFLDTNFNILRKSYFISTTKLLIAALGLDATKFSGHSFRAGSATSGAESGFSEWELKLLGRWASDAYTIYLRNPKIITTFAERLTKTD